MHYVDVIENLFVLLTLYCPYVGASAIAG
jgi:hypothetical protein